MGKYINTDNIKWYGSERITRLEDILAMPAEDVAPIVHAHWVDHMGKKFFPAHSPDYELVYDGGYNCSNCNHYEPMFGKNYCSNCGAKMDEEER